MDIVFIIKLVLAAVVILGGVGFFIYIKIVLSQNKQLKAENKSVVLQNEVIRQDNKMLVQYMVDNNKIKAVGKQDLKVLKETKNDKEQHTVLVDILKRANDELSKY